jgi:hypothetical protein
MQELDILNEEHKIEQAILNKVEDWPLSITSTSALDIKPTISDFIVNDLDPKLKDNIDALNKYNFDNQETISNFLKNPVKDLVAPNMAFNDSLAKVGFIVSTNETTYYEESLLKFFDSSLIEGNGIPQFSSETPIFPVNSYFDAPSIMQRDFLGDIASENSEIMPLE